jgi:hypothetical protein
VELVNFPEGFKERALVESGNGILNRTKLRFVCTEWWRAVRGVKGLTMNARFACPLDSAPGSQNRKCLSTAPTTLYTGWIQWVIATQAQNLLTGASRATFDLGL